VPWDQELVSFAAGFLLVVVVPCVLIRLWFKQRLGDYGLGLPQSSLPLALLSFSVLLVVGLVIFRLGCSGDDGMRATYPLYRGELEGLDFLWYELGYLLFFVAIEFVFRGYLLLGLYPRFGMHAIYVSMLAYVVWHIDKPTPELVGTFVWGPIAGAVVVLTRSIWPVVAAHWLLNVVLDGWLS